MRNRCVGLARRLRLVTTFFATTTLLLGPTAAHATSVQVHGSWQQLVNCALTSYDPVTKAFSCVGSTAWHGTWTGVTRYTVSGTADLVSGDASGTIRETFYGRADDGTRGRLDFLDQFQLDGATSRFHLDADIVRGRGGFQGSRGHATFDGTDNLATGSGTYAGWWKHPGRPPTRRRSGGHR
jgi:hypothetical protein